MSFTENFYICIRINDVKKILAFCFIFSSTFIFYSCHKDDQQGVDDAVACFTVDVMQSADSAHAFLFDQCPPAYDLSYWDFDDGQYSSNPNPSHVFNHYGRYDVKLRVTNTTGQSNSVTKTITIAPAYIDFYAVPKHHGVTIPSQGFYPDTLFLEHHSTQFPASASFDTFYVSTPGDTFVHFSIHQPDSMFIFMTGLDTVINMRVAGGIPYTVSPNFGSIHINVPVTE